MDAAEVKGRPAVVALHAICELVANWVRSGDERPATLVLFDCCDLAKQAIAKTESQ